MMFLKNFFYVSLVLFSISSSFLKSAAASSSLSPARTNKERVNTLVQQLDNGSIKFSSAIASKAAPYTLDDLTQIEKIAERKNALSQKQIDFLRSSQQQMDKPRIKRSYSPKNSPRGTNLSETQGILLKSLTGHTLTTAQLDTFLLDESAAKKAKILEEIDPEQAASIQVDWDQAERETAEGDFSGSASSTNFPAQPAREETFVAGVDRKGLDFSQVESLLQKAREGRTLSPIEVGLLKATENSLNNALENITIDNSIKSSKKDFRSIMQKVQTDKSLSLDEKAVLEEILADIINLVPSVSKLEHTELDPFYGKEQVSQEAKDAFSFFNKSNLADTDDFVSGENLQTVSAKKFTQAMPYFVAVSVSTRPGGELLYELFDAHALNQHIFNGSIAKNRGIVDGVMKTLWDISKDGSFKHLDRIEGSEKGVIATVSPTTRAPLYVDRVYYFSINVDGTKSYLGTARDLVSRADLQRLFTINSKDTASFLAQIQSSSSAAAAVNPEQERAPIAPRIDRLIEEEPAGEQDFPGGDYGLDQALEESLLQEAIRISLLQEQD